MRRLVVIMAGVLGVLTGARGAAADACGTEHCSIHAYWSGSPARIVDAAASGDRLLVALGGGFVVYDRGGRRVASVDDDGPVDFTRVVGTTGGFFDVRSGGAAVTVYRRDLAGAVVGAPIALQRGAPDVMNGATIDVRGGVLAVGWTVPLGRYATAYDAHLALIGADGARLADAVVPARAGAYSAAPVLAGHVVWLLWREDPNLRLVGVRFSDDGTRLDADPIELGREYNGFATETFGDVVRLYAESTRGTTDVFELATDGAVSPRGPAPPYQGHGLALPDGDVLRVAFDGDPLAGFPVRGTVTVTRERLDGATTVIARPGLAQVIPVLAGDELWLIAAEDVVDGLRATSTVALRRFTLAGAPLAAPELIVNRRAWIEDEYCETYPDLCAGCSAGGGAGAGAAIVVALGALAAVGAVRRRRATW